MKLKDKIVLVTGSSRGIGKATALLFAKEGASIVLNYHISEIEPDALDNIKSVMNDTEKSGAKTIIIEADVSNEDQVKKMIDETISKFRRIDILVNNAGINKPTDFDSITEEDWDNIMAVNLKGPFMCTKAALPLLRNSKAASVINIGSVSGQYGGPRTAHYAASKAGLISLGQVIARFGAEDNIRCNTIAAGLIESKMAEAGMKSEAVINASKNIILNRFGTQKEVADVVVFLASDKSSYITAQTINVNGGLYF